MEENYEGFTYYFFYNKLKGRRRQDYHSPEPGGGAGRWPQAGPFLHGGYRFPALYARTAGSLCGAIEGGGTAGADHRPAHGPAGKL